jgi:DNA helicase IV
VDTVRRFKGLESEVVIITELDELNEKEKELKENLLYVSFSRAKNHLIIVPSEKGFEDFSFK